MSVAPDQMTRQLDADKAAAASATQGLTDINQSFDPDSAAGPQPTFNYPEPQDHFKDVMAQAPLLMGLAAIGGAFGKMHGMTMLASTNAMMKGLVQGNDAAYSDARQKYDAAFDQYKTQQKTWFDTYRAYIQAYKGRVDAQARAVQGANAAVGMDIRDQAMTQKNVAQVALIQPKIDEIHAKIRALDSNAVSNRMRADAAKSNAAARTEQVLTQAKTADTNTLAAMNRSLKAEADGILKQYPPGKSDMPADVKLKLTSIREQIDIVTSKMDEHVQADYNKNKAVYDQARQAIAAGADPIAVKKRLSESGLNPDSL
jgi:hypothetical protein